MFCFEDLMKFKANNPEVLGISHGRDNSICVVVFLQSNFRIIESLIKKGNRCYLALDATGDVIKPMDKAGRKKGSYNAVSEIIVESKDDDINDVNEEGAGEVSETKEEGAGEVRTMVSPYLVTVVAKTPNLKRSIVVGFLITTSLSSDSMQYGLQEINKEMTSSDGVSLMWKLPTVIDFSPAEMKAWVGCNFMFILN